MRDFTKCGSCFPRERVERVSLTVARIPAEVSARVPSKSSMTVLYRIFAEGTGAVFMFMVMMRFLSVGAGGCPWAVQRYAFTD